MKKTSTLLAGATIVALVGFGLGMKQSAKLYGAPVILTTSDEAGPNGPLLPELTEMFPDAPLSRGLVRSMRSTIRSSSMR